MWQEAPRARVRMPHCGPTRSSRPTEAASGPFSGCQSPSVTPLNLGRERGRDRAEGQRQLRPGPSAPRWTGEQGPGHLEPGTDLQPPGAEQVAAQTPAARTRPAATWRGGRAPTWGRGPETPRVRPRITCFSGLGRGRPLPPALTGSPMSSLPMGVAAHCRGPRPSPLPQPGLTLRPSPAACLSRISANSVMKERVYQG